MEDKQNYIFKGTALDKKTGAHVALIQEGGSTFEMTVAELEQQLPNLKKKGMDQSAADFERALASLKQKNPETETVARYVFLRTTEQDGKFIALMADRYQIGDMGISSLQMAFKAHASPVSRAGILPMTAEQLKQRIPDLQQHGLHQSVDAFCTALACVNKKNGTAPVPQTVRAPAARQSM